MGNNDVTPYLSRPVESYQCISAKALNNRPSSGQLWIMDQRCAVQLVL